MKNLIKKLFSKSVLLNRILIYWRDYRTMVRIKRRFTTATFGRNFIVINEPLLELGNHVSFQDRVTIHCGGMDWSDYKGGVKIDDNSVFSSGCIIWGCGATVSIGKNFDCGPDVKIFASRTKYEDLTEWPLKNTHKFADVVIGDNVICYSNVVINPGVIIGDGAVIGANSIVMRDVEPYSVVAGNPAKHIKMRNKL